MRLEDPIMKRLHTFFIAQVVALIAIAFTSGTAVAVSQSINVSGQVSGVCKMSATSQTTMAFGPMDPSVASAPNKTATTNIVFKCTKKTAIPTVTVGGAATSPNTTLTMADPLAPTITLPYSVAWLAPTTNASGFGAGSIDTTVTLTGTVLATDYTAAPAGAYVDTLVVVVAP